MDFMSESTRRDRAHQIITGKRTNHASGTLETTSSSYYRGRVSSDEEEQDMANCLIMLAHSVSPNQTYNIATKSTYDNYECKTCNRAFQSFQALGGHRASHKKPKLTVQDNNNPVSIITEDQPKFLVFNEQTKDNNNINNNNNNNNNKKLSSTSPGFVKVTGYKNSKVKVHECSICGSEFLSGQALGGHMRRHRMAPSSSSQISHHNTDKSPMLSLDLNLPAPEVVDEVSSKFQFPTTSSSQQPLVFSATALVDCHY